MSQIGTVYRSKLDRTGVFLFLLLTFLSARAADAEIYVFDKNIDLPGPCVYLVRNVTAANFECNPDSEFSSAYSVHIMTSKDFAATKRYIENCRAESCETDAHKLLAYRKQKFGADEHYYFVLQLKAQNDQPEATAHKYTICRSATRQNNPCIEINSLSAKYIDRIVRQAGNDWIELDL